MEKVVIRFDGGEASFGRLHYYEYTRSQYATARFLSTVEHFRRTLTVAERITSQVRVEILVETPKEGSFLEILLLKAQETAAAAISAPLSSMISLVWSNLLPRSDKTDSDLVQLAKIRLAEEQERTRRSEQEALQYAAISEIVRTENATTQQALRLLEQSMQSSNPALGRAGLLQDRMLEMQRELELEQMRQVEIEPFKEEFSRIDNDKLIRLSSRLRPMVPEMALPLRKSAHELTIGSQEKGKPLLLIDSESVTRIVEKEVDEKQVKIRVHVRSYDRDRDVGKVSSSELSRQLSFSVSPADVSWLKPKVLQAMQVQEVDFTCRFYRDKDGTPTSILLDDIDFV